MTKITLEMPPEAAEKLLKDYKENPEAVKDYFKRVGINVEDILPHTNPSVCVYVEGGVVQETYTDTKGVAVEVFNVDNELAEDQTRAQVYEKFDKEYAPRYPFSC